MISFKKYEYRIFDAKGTLVASGSEFTQNAAQARVDIFREKNPTQFYTATIEKV